MKIKKRNGRLVNFNPQNITKRIKSQSEGLGLDTDNVSIKVISQISDGITTKELDSLAMEQCATMVTIHPNYSTLAARLFVTSLRKYTPDTFSKSIFEISEKTNFLSKEFIEFVSNNSEDLDSIIVQDRDFNHDYFGLKTLERSYLIDSGKNNGKITVERPQYMWLRTAIQVSDKNINKIKETYDLMSQGYYTHATPTLFNSGGRYPQLSSCFLLGLKEDSISGIFDTLKDTAMISQTAGGIGLHIHNVRASGSVISGTNGISNGIVPMLKVYNDTARYVDQGGGKRKGSFAIYLEPWHADIFDF